MATRLDSRALELIVLPTEHCNFRCRYCYEQFSGATMAAPVLDGIKRLIAARAAELDRLHIGWFGGEPLLARRIIEELSGYCVGLRSGWPMLRYSAGMATNGYLLDGETLSRLVSLGVTSYQITLDGPQVLHNATRVTRRGRGTFARIWSNLVAARAMPGAFEIIVRIHYRRDSYEQLFPLLDRWNETFADDGRFRVRFHPITRLGGRDDEFITPVSPAEQGGIEAALRARLARPEQVVRCEGYICYAAAANSLVIRANGDINKCTVALYDDANRIGRLEEGGTVTIDQEKFRRWIAPLLSGEPAKMACPYYGAVRREGDAAAG